MGYFCVYKSTTWLGSWKSFKFNKDKTQNKIDQFIEDGWLLGRK